MKKKQIIFVVGLIVIMAGLIIFCQRIYIRYSDSCKQIVVLARQKQHFKQQCKQMQKNIIDLRSQYQRLMQEQEIYHQCAQRVQERIQALHHKQALGNYMNKLWQIIFSEDEEAATKMICNATKYVDAVGNETLSRIWQQVLDNIAKEDESACFERFFSLIMKMGELARQDLSTIESLAEQAYKIGA